MRLEIGRVFLLEFGERSAGDSRNLQRANHPADISEVDGFGRLGIDFLQLGKENFRTLGIPEPSSLTLLLAGLAFFLLLSRKRPQDTQAIRGDDCGV